jgi:DNA-damage-inducible protein J
MPGKTTIQIRIDEDLKNKAGKILRRLHINMSEAVKMFLAQVVNKNGIPLDLFVPNEETQKVMDEVDRGAGLHEVSTVDELFEELDR